MNNQETLKVFFKINKGALLLSGLAIVSGALYAIYQYGHQEINWTILEKYLWSRREKEEIVWREYVYIFWSYYYKFLIIWALGEITYLLPVAICGTFLNILAYSYAIVCIYIYFGMPGIWMSMKLFGLQGVILSALLLKVNLYQIEKCQNVSCTNTYAKWKYLLEGTLGNLLITLVEALLMADVM